VKTFSLSIELLGAHPRHKKNNAAYFLKIGCIIFL
jgi:hypothetical protein